MATTAVLWQMMYRIQDWLEERNQCKQCFHNRLVNICVPRHALMCHNVTCRNENHRQQLSRYCKQLIQICVEGDQEYFPTLHKKVTQVPYWNEAVQPLKDDALFWKSILVSCGKPREEVVAQIMRRSKHKYLYTIRVIKKRDDDLRKSWMAESLIYERNHRNFWAEYKTHEGQSKQKPSHMNDRTEPKYMAELLTDKYSTLYNYVPSDEEELCTIKNKIKEEFLQYKDSEHIITVYEVRKEISRLCEDRSDRVMGNSGLMSFMLQKVLVFILQYY